MIETIDRHQMPSLHALPEITIPEAKKQKLDNGIPVYIINAGKQDILKVEFMFRNDVVSSKSPSLISSANKMLAEGTSAHTAMELAEMLDYYGSFFETEYSFDTSSVVLYTLSKHLEKSLVIIKEILFDAIFPEQELSTYKQNSRQHLIVNNEKVGYVARKKFNEMVFGSTHAYGYVEKLEDYDTMQREELRSVFSALYTKDNCTVLVAGKEPGDLMKVLNANFGGSDWKKTGVLSSSVSGFGLNIKHGTQNTKLFIEKKNSVQSAIRIGKPLFNKTNPDYAGMNVLNTVLGGYFGSRLMSNIREDKGYTYGIGSAVVSLLQGGYFFIAAETGVKVTEPAIHEIYKEIERLKTEIIPTEELSMVKNYLSGSFLRSFDGAFQLADRCKGIIIYGLNYDYFYNYLKVIKTITPEELRHLANKYFQNDSFYELVVGGK